DVARRIRIDNHRNNFLSACGDRSHGATACARLNSLMLEVFLQLLHPALHLLHLAQHLHRILHSETSFTLVTRPSNRRTISRTKGSSSGLAGRCAGLVASLSRSRKSIFTSSPTHLRTWGINCADCSCAFWW